MATKVSTQKELHDLMRLIVQAQDGDFSDFNEGSMLDILSGAYTTGMNELSELIISEFKKTYFETSHGPEVTGNVDDLQNLAVDHYSDTFKRPKANESTGTATFSRPTVGAGDVSILKDTVIKTEKDASGQEVLFKTISDVLLVGLTIDVGIIADLAGSDGNVDPAKIIVIDTALTDSTVTVTNVDKMAGGSNEETDAEYRETIRFLIQSLAGATKSAIEGIILSVAGVSIATLIEKERIVIDYDIALDQILAGASFFRIPYPVAYIADENGESSQALIDSVIAAIKTVRACGVKIEVLGATAVPLSWDAAYTLNAGGPNFAELQTDFSKITDSMADHINSLDISDSFIRTDANEYILSIWGPAGTNDLTSFNTNSPVSNISVNATEKIIPNVMSINGVVA